ncbi:MAG TPA: GAF and ANTAR domain-containing protein, partial [Aquihabitans sp.]|nr:GAF and ANTAR domain-containing protein [Aquihabitans sp.]
VRVAEMFGEVARALVDEDESEVLDRIVNLAVEHLDNCDFAGVSMVKGRRITSPASSNDIPKVVDRIQEETGEGPCIDAIREHEVFRTGNLEAEERWPNFASRAHDETGVCSILSVRLFIEEDTMGALNLYSADLEAFDETDEALASVFAVHAAVAITSARREHNLEQKATSRDLIGQAKGILMARQQVTDDQAFDMLRRASQRMNVKLVEVAERITHTGEAPEGGSADAGIG